MIDSRQSAVIRWLVSSNWSPILPAKAALARPGPIDAATSATVTGPGNARCEPSGSVMGIMGEDFLFCQCRGCCGCRWCGQAPGTEPKKGETGGCFWEGGGLVQARTAKLSGR